MKKNISINLQGIIFHIEEDGYDVLGRYLAEVKAHFAGYRGHEDIVADIEGRIAEIFGARLSPTQQVITLADVEAMMAKMGRVRDFATDTDEDDEAEPVGAAGYASAGSAYSYGSATATAPPPTATEDGPRRLYRDMSNRKIAGVAAGIAQYFRVNSLWIRLGFLGLFFLKPFVKIMSLGMLHLDISGGSAALALFSYIILWIALPKHYNAPPLDDNFDFKSLNNGRKYFRDTDNGKIGGVAAGLAPYLNLDVTLIRVLLLAGLFAGGFTFLLYLILWIAAPQAKTVADRMRMRGEDMTLEGFDSSVRNNAFDGSTPGGNRPLGSFLEDLARNLRPLVDFIGSAIRVFAGFMLTLIGFGMLVASAIFLGVALGLIPSSENIIMGDIPVHVFVNGVPGWALIAGFLSFAIPAVSLFLAGLNLLLRRSFLSRTVSLSLLGLWLLSVVGVVMATVRQSRDFQYDAEVEQVSQFPALTTPVLRLDARDIDRQHEQRVNVRLVSVDSGRTVEVLRTYSAKGPSEAEARRTASTSISHNVQAKGDSTLLIDDHFSFQSNASYRDQEVDLTIRLPRDRTFRLGRNFTYLLGDGDFVGNREPNEPELHRYRLVGNKLECIGCTPDQLRSQDNNDSDDDEQDGDLNLDIDLDEDGDDTTVKLNFGKVPGFNTDLSYYGDDRRTFSESDFEQVHVGGNYRVMVRQGAAFKVEAAGSKSALEGMRVVRKGNTLSIRPKRSGFFGSDWSKDGEKVLLSIEMPTLNELELAGAVRGDVSGFRGDRLKVEQAGASHLRLSGEFDKLDMDLAGACRSAIKGSARELKLDGAGACELAAPNFKVRTADIDLAGMSKARVNVSETLKADVVGACLIEYSGNPKNVDTDAAGASRVKRLKD
ncbi:hypothetical protein GCM10023185_14540 [Hymenobacter saemangeumensis]|uniref:PspC domain-containing protein n=1 Tax=Hymenobacter saemangeumensis TaxID=1084522 RepID=A0ABP8I8M8_9BACT